jgi:hypothetical protein
LIHANLLEALRQSCAKHLLFLVRDYRFSGPILEVDDGSDIARQRYVGEHLAIEILMETREFDVRCHVGRVVDGVPTRHHAVDRQGNVVRFSLLSWIHDKVGKLPPGPRLAGSSREQEIETVVADTAKLLLEHAPEILADDPAAFDHGSDRTGPAQGH